jgi:ribosomal protein S27E
MSAFQADGVGSIPTIRTKIKGDYMTKCCSCGRELHVTVPAGTEVYCNICADTQKSPNAARKTLKIDINVLISNYDGYLQGALNRFRRISEEPFSFEKDYALSGCQSTIDDYRRILYWLKKNIGEEQDGVVDSIE